MSNRPVRLSIKACNRLRCHRTRRTQRRLLLEKSDGIGSCEYPPLDTGRALATDSQSELAHGGPATGLSEIPSSWPELPANASLQVEISLFSANRLRVTDGNGVDLSRELSPVPGYSALSWLETSILFPGKFADISVKATQNQEDEKEHVRREKMAIDEVRGILAKMLEARDG